MKENNKIIKALKKRNIPYLIGETAYNHEGDIKYLYKMIDDIASLGLEAVKFHLLLNPESYMQSKHPLIKEIKKWVFDKKEWDKIIEYSNKKGLDVIALCDDVESINYIISQKKKVAAIELHASGLNDYFLLSAVSKFPGLVILGVGGSTLDEILYAINFLKSKGKKDILLMYGFQSYPTKYSEINLSKMLKLRELFNLPIGYADHTGFDDANNEVVSILGAAMGINILEKHYTPDFGKERIDYHAAVSKKQMKNIRKLMELALSVFGDDNLNMSEAELKYGNTGPMKKAIVAKKDIKKGEKLSLENLWFKRTKESSSLKQKEFINILGLKAVKDIKKDEIIDYSKVKYRFKKSSLKDFTHKEVDK